MRIAAIDVGTNSTRLLVTEKNGDILQRISSDLITTRIGEGITGGALQQLPMLRTVEAIKKFKDKALKLGCEKIIVAATSAVRDAANNQEFVKMVEKETGLIVNIIPGELEAELSYLGVVKDFPAKNLNILGVLDIGGGSTELIWSTLGGEVVFTSSQVGAVRMSEVSYTDLEIKEILKQVLARAKQVGLKELIGVGGTVTTLAAIAQELETYDWQKIHGFNLSINKINQIYLKLSAMNIQEREKVKGLQKARADIILAGINILLLIMNELEIDQIIASESDILQGLFYYYN